MWSVMEVDNLLMYELLFFHLVDSLNNKSLLPRILRCVDPIYCALLTCFSFCKNSYLCALLKNGTTSGSD